MPLQALQQEGFTPVLFFYNPNIHPKEEYIKRLEVLTSYAQHKGLQMIEGAYEPELWEERVGIYGGPHPLIASDEEYDTHYQVRKQRCAACYALRFEHLAQRAEELELLHIASTLAVSPYQFTELINDTLLRSAAEHSKIALRRDWRDLYSDASKLSREVGMYRQNYCGCRYSQEEAELERQARKMARKRLKTHNAHNAQKEPHENQ